MTRARHLARAGRFLVSAFTLALFAALLFPLEASAHAILLRSDPTKDAVLTAPPAQVRMWFSENLNPTFSTAYVVNAANSAASTVTDTRTHVDAGNAHVSANDPKEMDLSLKPSLAPAVYAVIWRTQSADDGHILYGSFLFTIAEPNGTIPKLSGSQAGQGTVNGGSASTGLLDGPTLLSFVAVTLVDLGVVFWVAAQLWLTFVLQLTETDQQEERAIYQRVEQRFERIFSVPTLLLLLVANVGVLGCGSFFCTTLQL